VPSGADIAVKIVGAAIGVIGFLLGGFLTLGSIVALVNGETMPHPYFLVVAGAVLLTGGYSAAWRLIKGRPPKPATATDSDDSW
jgi:hypothetical protein